MIGKYKSKRLDYFMDKFPKVKNLMASSDYISSCNFSMNFFPVVLNADDEVGMSMKVPISNYFTVSKNIWLGVRLEQSIVYDIFDDDIHIYARDNYNQNIDKLSIYIRDYLTKHDTDTNWSINLFMWRDKESGFGYRIFWAAQLAWRLINITWQADGVRDPENHKEQIIEIIKNIQKITSKKLYKRWTFLGPLWHNNSHPVYFNNKEVVNLYQHSNDYVPVDIVLINFGAGYERNISLNSIDDRHDLMSKYISNLNNNYKKDYLNNFAYCLKAEFINNYENLINNSNNDIYMQSLMNTIDHINNFASIVEWPNEIINQINDIIKKTKKFPNEYIWVLPMTSNQNSDNIMIISNKNKSRHTIDVILDKIYEMHPFALEYVSWLDDDYRNGIEINNRNSRNIYMPELVEYDCVVYFADGSYIYDRYSDLISSYKDCIILDSISNKIYHNNKSLDSKDIVSQSYTIYTVWKLISKLNIWIENKDLEASAYSKSMNQFSGKILSPLKKVTEELLGKAIDIQITGNIYHYQIKMQKSDSKIIYIKKRDI